MSAKQISIVTNANDTPKKHVVTTTHPTIVYNNNARFMVTKDDYERKEVLQRFLTPVNSWQNITIDEDYIELLEAISNLPGFKEDEWYYIK